MSFPRNSSSLRDRRRASPYRGLAPVRPAGLRPRGLPPAGSGPAGLRGGAGRPAWPPRSLPRRILASCARLRKLDWILLAAVLALGLVGTLLVWSATQPSLLQAGADPRAYLKKQLLNIGLGLILMLAVSTLDYRQLRLLAPIGYGLSCLGLVVVLTPLGSVVNGAHSWISLPGGFQLEPSEYAKLSIVVVAAMILGELRPGDDRPRMRAVMAAVACSAVPLILVVLQPDLGVTILMMTMLAGLVVLSGIRLRWLAALAAAGGAGAVAAVNLHLLKSYQLSRLTSFMNPSADPRGTGYSAAQSKIAIGSGGLLGHGLFHGPLTAGNFVPEQHTDFIFSVAGEELGFAGAAVIIALLAVVFLRALRIAAQADDQFGMLVAAGIAIWFAVQSFVNIGMTIGIMPVTGLPLPFVSYGGSAMFADMIAIGMLQAVHRHLSIFS
ncbi:MAG TPA: rod shape-determining protein RodA [Streptosporangiaceae bacterium]|nr:rod shape-determining protein RodA [Streptosporangiaceae bacterium]